MKLQITDSDTLSSLSSRSASIDKEVLSKLLNKPMQIESLVMKSNRLTELKLVNTQSLDSTSKIANIPKSLLLELSLPQLTKLLNGGQEITLTRTGNTILLKAAESISGQASVSVQTKLSQPLQQSLAFAKAVAVDNQTLLLANQVNKMTAESQNVPTNLQSQITNKSSNGKINASQPLDNTQQLISQALKNIINSDSGTANSSIAKHFNQLNKNTQLLAQRILGIASNETNNTSIKHFNTNDSVTLLKELAQANYFPVNSKLANGLKSLISLVNTYQKIQMIANPTDKKASVSIQNRLLQSGNFMESKLAKSTLTTSTLNPETPKNTSLPINNNQTSRLTPSQARQIDSSQSISPTQPQDLKLLLKEFYQQTKLVEQFINQTNQLTPLLQKLALSPLLLNTTNNSSPQNLSPNQNLNQPLNQTSGLVSSVVTSQSDTQIQNPTSKSHLSSLATANPAASSSSNQNLSARSLELIGHYVNWLQLKPAANKVKGNSNQTIDILAYKELLGALQKSSETILQRIETNQLLSARAANMGLVQYLVDLPIHHNSQIDSFEMLFDGSDTKQSLKSCRQWKVTIRFELEPLGPVFARVSLNNERITTDFYAKQKSTSDLINQHLDKLHSSLLGAGLDIDRLGGQQGLVPDHLAAEELAKATQEKVDIRI